MSVKGLNYTEGQNRFRFQRLSDKLQNIHVDVVHRVKQTGSLDATVSVPDSGSQGCFFQDELENLKDLNLTSHFKRYMPAHSVAVLFLIQLYRCSGFTMAYGHMYSPWQNYFITCQRL